MRILVIGGTRFVGRHLVDAALAGGHAVTVFHRGRTGPDLFPDAEHRTGDRDDPAGLAALADGEWDATVDTCAYLPRQVTSLAEALGGRGGHHLLISSVSAYADPTGPGGDEDSPLAELADASVEEVTDQTYGGLKVLCEREARRLHGPRTLLVRPTYVVGPADYTWRFPWWVARIARGGEVLAPGPREAPAQLIDARDMASWMVGLLEQDASGAFHAVGPTGTFTWGEQLDAIAAAVAPAGTTLTWVDRDVLAVEGVGQESLPLWSGDDPDVWMMAMDPARAFGSGLRPRPLADTVRDTLAWTRTAPPPDGTGLTPTDEKRVLAAWHASESSQRGRTSSS